MYVCNDNSLLHLAEYVEHSVYAITLIINAGNAVDTVS